MLTFFADENSRNYLKATKSSKTSNTNSAKLISELEIDRRNFSNYSNIQTVLGKLSTDEYSRLRIAEHKKKLITNKCFAENESRYSHLLFQSIHDEAEMQAVLCLKF